MSVAAVSEDGRSRELASGGLMPMLGLGVWQVPDGPQCVRTVRWALDLGYWHIDTAQAYGNEQSVGKALRDSGVPRDEVFITTKFLPRLADPVTAAEDSLRRLGVDQVDLYVVHWPQDGPAWAWPGMERARDLGFARSIGVSNFSVGELDHLRGASTGPAVNQVSFSPFQYRSALLEACREREIALEAYSPLGPGRNIGDEAVQAAARRVGRTPAQVLLRWCVQHEVPVLTKSTHRERIGENARIFDFALSAEDMAELDGLDQTGGTSLAQERKWW
jgi:methylglyoxal/glyoxal reductase